MEAWRGNAVHRWDYGTVGALEPPSDEARGGLRHLLRVLDQLERTYDVYGMEPDALLSILPEEFRQWDGGPGPDR